MKKIYPIILFITLAFVLVGCTKKDKKDVYLELPEATNPVEQLSYIPQTPPIIESPVLVENPTFNDVVLAGCGDTNSYIGKQVQWKAKISNYAHTSGIRFIVIDEDHPQGSEENHGHFWGTFLVSADDPRYTEEGLQNWREKWHSRWVDYILDVYGDIEDDERDEDTQFLVDTTIDYVSCEERDGDKIYNDGGYIETFVNNIVIWSD